MITTKRKTYLAPELSTITIDQEITLVMISEPPVDPPIPTGPKKSAATPFGGNLPDYGSVQE